MKQKLATSIQRLTHWVESHNYQAYDPGDGNNSFLHFLTFDIILLERFLQQAVYRAPFNLRPLLGIPPHTSTKGMGYLAWGFVKMHKLTGEAGYAEKARAALAWLIEHKAPKYSHYCWGNDFLFSSRAGRIPKQEPTIVWSSLIGHAFLEAYEVFGDQKFLEVAESVCQWILSVPREKTPAGSCLSYIAYAQSSIHNSSLLGAGLLARAAQLTKINGACEVAREAVLYTCSRQLPDGAWYYGEAPKNHWIDNFHTGYNLDNLKRYRDATGDRTFDENIRRGFDYFKRTFFEPNGRPKYYHNKALPIDIQAAAQAIDTLSFFAAEDSDALPLAQKVAHWTIDNMQAQDGHFYYRDLGWAVNRTPMLHWGQGTMFKALAHLLTQLSASEPPLTSILPLPKGEGRGEGEGNELLPNAEQCNSDV
jgi:rhamnogalacturonyl hydrolase YesR